MFEDLDVVAERLLASAPQDDPWDPVLDRDGSLVDRLVTPWTG